MQRTSRHLPRQCTTVESCDRHFKISILQASEKRVPRSRCRVILQSRTGNICAGYTRPPTRAPARYKTRRWLFISISLPRSDPARLVESFRGTRKNPSLETHHHHVATFLCPWGNWRRDWVPWILQAEAAANTALDSHSDFRDNGSAATSDLPVIDRAVAAMSDRISGPLQGTLDPVHTHPQARQTNHADPIEC